MEESRPIVHSNGYRGWRLECRPVVEFHTTPGSFRGWLVRASDGLTGNAFICTACQLSLAMAQAKRAIDDVCGQEAQTVMRKAAVIGGLVDGQR